MKKDALALLFFIVALCAIGLAGCRESISQPDNSTAKAVPASGSMGAILRDIGSATAGSVVADHMAPFFAAGLSLIIMGGIGFIFGARATGAGLAILGIATTSTGVLFVQYPWVVLLVTVLLGALLVVSMYGAWKTRKAAAVVVEAVGQAPNKREVTGYIKALGPKTEQLVNRLVIPIEEMLAEKSKATVAER